MDELAKPNEYYLVRVSYPDQRCPEDVMHLSEEEAKKRRALILERTPTAKVSIFKVTEVLVEDE